MACEEYAAKLPSMLKAGASPEIGSSNKAREHAQRQIQELVAAKAQG